MRPPYTRARFFGFSLKPDRGSADAYSEPVKRILAAMNLMSALRVSMSAIQAHSQGMVSAAHNIANMHTPGFRTEEPQFSEAEDGGVIVTLSEDAKPPDNESGTDLAEEAVRLKAMEHGVKANATVFHRIAELNKGLIDTLG